jgi:hypothetical protein
MVYFMENPIEMDDKWGTPGTPILDPNQCKSSAAWASFQVKKMEA